MTQVSWAKHEQLLKRHKWLKVGRDRLSAWNPSGVGRDRLSAWDPSGVGRDRLSAWDPSGTFLEEEAFGLSIPSGQSGTDRTETVKDIWEDRTAS